MSSSMLSRPSTLMDKERGEALAAMDLVKIMKAYVQTMIDTTPGYKGLLVDKDTMRFVSSLFGRTEFAEHNIVNIEKLESGDTKEHLELQAICFLRPTRENINLLKKELRKPRYKQYRLFFTNLVSSIFLQELAEADVSKEQIEEVQEMYGDYVVIDRHHFTIPVPRNDLLLLPKAVVSSASQSTAEYELIDRFVQGLSALFLSIRRRPVIRYQQGSDSAKRLADSLYGLTYKQQYQVFDFGSRSTPIVLILERKDDPVTPLLTQWTYQAMVHELIGITDNTVKLTSSKVQEQFREIVMDPQHDEFYRKHMYLNYGAVGLSVKSLVEQFSSTSQKHKQVDSLEDMRRFVTEHQDFTKLQSNVSKHVNVMSELSDVISKRTLMDVSMAEQEVANPAANLTAALSYEEVSRLIQNPATLDKDKIRLVMLYALRFESETVRVRQLQDTLVTAGVRTREPNLLLAVEGVLKYAGNSQRAGDLYGNRSLLNKAFNVFKGVKGVENVYTQHTPLLNETLNQLQQDKLDPNTYPYMASSQDEAMQWQQSFRRAPAREVIIFIIGGTTYEEAKAVRDWSDKNPAGVKVLLGGSAVLNSDSFIAAMAAAGGAAENGSSSSVVDIR